jgi:hypothetical protein
MILSCATYAAAAQDVGTAPGSIDTTFNPQVNGPVGQLVLGANGKIVIGGNFTTVGGISRMGLAECEC